jgi:hypothetical protein
MLHRSIPKVNYLYSVNPFGFLCLSGLRWPSCNSSAGINAIIYYGPRIFESAGIASGNALVFQVIIGTINLLFTFVAIKYADKFGRRFLLTHGPDRYCVVTGIMWLIVL